MDIGTDLVNDQSLHRNDNKEICRPYLTYTFLVSGFGDVYNYPH